MRPQQTMAVEDCDEDVDTVRDAARRGDMPRPIVRTRSGTECPSLVRGRMGSCDAQALLALLDLNTHGDDGRDVLREVRSDDAIGALPVMVPSVAADARDLQICSANGANAYHVKRVDHGLHLEVLQDIFAYWLCSVVLPPRHSSA